MLQHTFLHLPGIGPKGERGFWKRGLSTWDQLAQGLADGHVRVGRPKAMLAALRESGRRLAGKDARYFAERLPSGEHWRLFGCFQEDTGYLDIETTGLGPDHNHITTMSLYGAGRIRHYVHEQNLGRFPGHAEKFKVLVTYNGKCFDVPFIQQSMGIQLPHTHIDLRYVLKSLGYSGGLKGCERQLGMARDGLEGVDGYFAVLLWEQYCQSGSREALDTLLAYNIEDTVNLEKLMVLAYNRKIRQTPFADEVLGEDLSEPQRPFRPHMETVNRIRRELAMRHAPRF